MRLSFSAQVVILVFIILSVSRRCALLFFSRPQLCIYAFGLYPSSGLLGIDWWLRSDDTPMLLVFPVDFDALDNVAQHLDPVTSVSGSFSLLCLISFFLTHLGSFEHMLNC